MSSKPKIAYFSMEICVESGIPTYSGGLGILAGDTVRSAADLKIPITYGSSIPLTQERIFALNGSFFNTQRMIQEYVLKAYL